MLKLETLLKLTELQVKIFTINYKVNNEIFMVFEGSSTEALKYIKRKDYAVKKIAASLLSSGVLLIYVTRRFNNEENL